MRHDSPAAFPLIGLIAGLCIGPLLINPLPFAIGLTLVWIAALCRRFSVPVKSGGKPPHSMALFVVLGIWLSLNVQKREAGERAAFASLDEEVFATIEVPIERDWAMREESFVLRASHFRANGFDFDMPISIWARFEPPEIDMQSFIRAECFLRTNDRGAYTASIKSALLMTYEGELPRWHPSAWNRALANRIERAGVDHPDEVALAQALVLGRGERLSQELRDGFRRGGTYHLLVFSGLQIAFAAGLLAALLRWLHRPRAADWLLLTFAVLAPPFIGPTASVARASTGIGLYALSRMLKRPTSLENLFCVAALLRLIIEPRDLHEASFHLTYAGAGALLFIGKQFRKPMGHVLAAEIVMAPLTLHHFHQFVIGGSLLTLLISPLIFAMLILSTLAMAMPMDGLLEAIGALHRLCAMLNALGLSGVFASPPLPATILGGVLALLAVALLSERKRALAVVVAMLIPSTAAIAKHIARRNVEHPRVTFLDVGQGDAIVLRSGSHTILVDGGGDDRILALLADRGIRRIDVVLLTHAHPDHCAGLASVLEHFDVGAVWISPRRFHGQCPGLMGAPLHLVRDGQRLSLDGLNLTAHLADRTFRRAPENNASIVLRVVVRGRTFLLTGDIEKEAELSLEDRHLRADVLKIAHHGSRSSTSDRFLDLVEPRLAVISCGRRNLFGHPHPSVLARLEERRIRTWRTDRDGSVDIEVREGKLYVGSRIE